MELIVDVSVVMAALSPHEGGHNDAFQLLKRAHAARAVLREPPQFLLELYAVLTRKPRQLRELGFLTDVDPMIIKFTPLGQSEVQSLVDWLIRHCPGKCPTKGADLAYVSAALETRLPLVTLDAGMQTFRSCGLDVCGPKEATSRFFE